MNDLKSLATNWGPLSGMIRGRASGYRSLARSVQHRAQLVERAVDVDVRDIDMPVLMRCRRLLKSGSFLARRRRVPPQPAGLPEHPPDAGGTDGHQIGVQEHVGKPPVTGLGVERLKIEDPLLFPIAQPKIPGDLSVVLVLFAVAFSPVVELADGEDFFDGAFGPFGPTPDEVYNLVALVRLDPGTLQRSPNSFFSAMCSVRSSAMTSSFWRSLLSSF